jgi:hypothetical protein
MADDIFFDESELDSREQEKRLMQNEKNKLSKE